MYGCARLILLAAAVLQLLAAGARAEAPAPPAGRFFHSGNGRLKLQSNKNSARFQGRYRLADGSYETQAYQQICRVFGAPCEAGGGLSLRLIEFLDFLEDHFKPGAWITITSGYRAPQYNRRLREKGRLAAKASLHQYGMAADLEMAGVSSRRIWDYVKALGFGGTGYYHGKTVHIDVGPARSWDEKSSGVGTGISNDNKLIGLVADYDIYLAGAPLVLRFIRMTAFPVGVRPQFHLLRVSADDSPGLTTHFVPSVGIAAGDSCNQFNDIDGMQGIRWRLPADIAPGRYRIGARFCAPAWPGMSAEVMTPVFRIEASR